MIDIVILTSLFVAGFVAVALVGSQAYFRGEQSKPIHERNWKSDGFEALAENITGQPTDFNTRVPGFRTDSYSRNMLPE